MLTVATVAPMGGGTSGKSGRHQFFERKLETGVRWVALFSPIEGRRFDRFCVTPGFYLQVGSGLVSLFYLYFYFILFYFT